MFLRMDFIKAEVKKRLKPGKKYYIREEVAVERGKQITWDSYIFIQEFYHGHVLCRVNGKYNTSYTYQDLYDRIVNGGIK